MWALLAHFPSSKWMFIIIKNNERWVFSFQSIFFHFSGLFVELPKTKKKKIRINSIEKTVYILLIIVKQFSTNQYIVALLASC